MDSWTDIQKEEKCRCWVATSQLKKHHENCRHQYFKSVFTTIWFVIRYTFQDQFGEYLDVLDDGRVSAGRSCVMDAPARPSSDLDNFNSWFISRSGACEPEHRAAAFRKPGPVRGPRRPGRAELGWTGHWKTPFVRLTQRWPPWLAGVTMRGLKLPDYPG